MNRTPQQESDYDIINRLWKIFRDYGNITNEDRDLERWAKIIDLSDELVTLHPETRGMVKELRFILNDRAKSQN